MNCYRFGELVVFMVAGASIYPIFNSGDFYIAFLMLFSMIGFIVFFSKLDMR